MSVSKESTSSSSTKSCSWAWVSCLHGHERGTVDQMPSRGLFQPELFYGISVRPWPDEGLLGDGASQLSSHSCKISFPILCCRVHSATLKVSKCHFLNSTSSCQKAVFYQRNDNLLSNVIIYIIFKERKLVQSLCEWMKCCSWELFSSKCQEILGDNVSLRY